MVTVSNGFEQGTNGSTITAAGSGGGSDTAFDVVTVSGTGSTTTYDNTHAQRGALSGKFVAAGTSGTSFVQWSSSTTGTLTTLFARAYFWLAANPTSVAQVIRLQNGSNLAADLTISNTGIVQVRDASNAIVGSSAASVPTGQWVRLEFKVVCSATTGTLEARVYTTPNSTTPSETVGPFTGQNTNTAVTISRAGASCTGSGSPSLTAWLDDIGVSDTNWLGPSTTVSGAATFTATGTLSSGAVVSTTGAAALTATGLLTSTGTAATTGTTALSGTGALAVSGGALEVAGTALTATGSLTAVGGILATSIHQAEAWSQLQSWLEKPSIQGFRDNRRWSQAQTWEVHLDITPPVVPLPVEIPPLEVMRQSYVYPAPTLNDRGWPAGWEYTSSTVEKWANYVQVVINYKTFSISRGVPAIVESWSTTSPYTWGVATVRLPAFTGFDDHTSEGIEEGAECRLFKVNTDNSRGKLLFQGLVASVEDRSGGVALTVEMQGWLNSALLAVCQPNLGTVTLRDLATVIGETLDGTPSRRFGVTYRNATGILDQTRGSLDQTRLDFVTGRLAQATSEDGTQSYTVVMAGSRPSVVEKDRTTVAYTVRYGQPGITVDLSKDVTQTPNVIYGSGVDPESRFWRNTKYPKGHPDDSLPYPFNDAGSVISIGTSDGDTDSGSGVSDWQRRVNYLNIGPDVTVDGDYSASDASACRTIQSHYGILVDGIVGPQTWDATFGVGSNVGDLNSAYVAPLAYVPAVEKHTYYASGAISGDNSAFDNSVLRVEAYIEYGENITKADAIRSAKAQIARDYPAGWVGEVTFNADPNECHRREIVADKVINLRGFQSSDVKLYIAEAVVDNLAGSVTCKVSEKALDLLSLAAVWQRDRDAKLDPAKQAFDQQRKSRQTDDTSVQWDSEDICGVIPRAALYHGLWSVLRIPFAQVADLAQTILTTSSPAAPFAVGVFGKPINASDLNRYVGNPLSQSSPWDTNADVLNDTYGLWMSWGSQDQPCGYYPSDASSSSPTLTGRMKDTAGFHFASANPPWAWVAFYSSSSCFIEGRFEFSVPS